MMSARSIVPVLRDICRKEGIEFESDALERIAERNRGDLRGAINDLQAATEGRDSIAVEDVVTGDRDKALGLFPYLDAVLKEESAEEALQSAYAVDETPDDLTKWIENNVLDVYDPSEVVRAYDFLANADVAGARPGHPELLVLALRHRQRGRGRRRRPRRDQGRVDALRPPAVLEPFRRDRGRGGRADRCQERVQRRNRASRGAPVSGGGHPPLQAPRADGRDGGRLRPRRGGNRLRHRLRRIDEQGGVDRRRRAGAARSGWRTTPRAPSPAAAAADDLGASDGETTNASGTASSSGDDGDADGTTDGDGSDANDGNDDDDDGQAGLSDSCVNGSDGRTIW